MDGVAATREIGWRFAQTKLPILTSAFLMLPE